MLICIEIGRGTIGLYWIWQALTVIRMLGFRHVHGAFKHARRATQQELAVLAWKLACLLDCPGFCHVLVHCGEGKPYDNAPEW